MLPILFNLYHILCKIGLFITAACKAHRLLKSDKKMDYIPVILLKGHYKFENKLQIVD